MSGNYHLVATDSNGCKGVSNTINITITSIANSFTQNKIYLYPNPVTDNLQIQTALPIKEIEITDITGRMLYISTAKTINCSSFAKGVYFITLTTEEGKAVKKFVKE